MNEEGRFDCWLQLPGGRKRGQWSQTLPKARQGLVKRQKIRDGNFHSGNFHRKGGEILEQKPREEWDFHPLR